MLLDNSLGVAPLAGADYDMAGASDLFELENATPHILRRGLKNGKNRRDYTDQVKKDYVIESMIKSTKKNQLRERKCPRNTVTPIFQGFEATDISFDMGSYNDQLPTAQSTPLVTARRSTSMLSTPVNNSVSSLAAPVDTATSTPLGSSATSGPRNHSSPARANNHRLSEAPRTPTPFKKALADVYRRELPLSHTVSLNTM